MKIISAGFGSLGFQLIFKIVCPFCGKDKIFYKAAKDYPKFDFECGNCGEKFVMEVIFVKTFRREK